MLMKVIYINKYLFKPSETFTFIISWHSCNTDHVTSEIVIKKVDISNSTSPLYFKMFMWKMLEIPSSSFFFSDCCFGTSEKKLKDSFYLQSIHIGFQQRHKYFFLVLSDT